MRLTYPLPEQHDRRALHAHLVSLAVEGYTGASVDNDSIHLEFPERDALTPQEEALAADLVSSYLFTPTWALVRRLRVPLLAEADWRIQRAEDNGEDASELRAYRQALRDVTNGPDPLNPTWPVRPWQ